MPPIVAPVERGAGGVGGASRLDRSNGDDRRLCSVSSIAYVHSYLCSLPLGYNNHSCNNQ
jgi:hypothetical protein